MERMMTTMLAQRWRDLEFHRMLDQVPAGAYTCNADGLITYYNDSARRVWGRAPHLNDSRDRYCGSFRLFSAEGLPVPHADCWMAKALLENRPYHGMELVIERSDGTRRTVLAHVNPFHDESGGVAGAINVLVDITERKQLEEKLRLADQRKDEFLAMLAHELRNPLAAMHLATQLLQQSELDPEDRQTASATLDRQLAHLTRVVDDLLDVSRIHLRKLELRRSQVDLRTVLHQALETCRPCAEEKGLRLEVAIPEATLLVEGDAVRLAQVFVNLLGNACKYTPGGGLVELTVGGDAAAIVVTIRDSGVGIAPEMLDKVFEMFTQADRSIERSNGGLGIGLTLVRRLVEMHGGSVQAVSAGLDQGSEFTVTLPRLQAAELASASAAALKRQAAASANGQLRHRILVVDDNRDAANALAMLLKLRGHVIATAYDGESALDQAAEFAPTVILLDIGLPRMSGYEVAAQLRARPRGESVRLVALTGWGQDEDRRKTAEAGFDAHLVKPVDHRLLAELLAPPVL